MSDVAGQLETIFGSYSPQERTSVALIISNLIEMAIEKPEERVVIAGTANLARSTHESNEEIRAILEALEEQVVLLRLLSDTSDSMNVRIGREQSEKGLQTTSLVTMGYGSALGALGVIGPTRMDYTNSMSAVNAVARYVGRFLAGESQ